MSKRAEKRATVYVRKVRREDKLADKKALQRMAADLTEREAEAEQLRAALWPFAMKALKGTAVCEDDYRRAGEAMPYAPDHHKPEDGGKCVD